MRQQRDENERVVFDTEANLKEPKAECKPLRAASTPLVEIVARNPKPGLEEELVFTPEYFQVIPTLSPF